MRWIYKSIRWFSYLNFWLPYLFKKQKRAIKNIFSKKPRKKSSFKLSVIGELNILNNKVSFKKVRTDNYNASEEDLNYFKDKFETTLFDKSFLDIFEIKKIRDFIYEIS